jgi:transcriptional regulator with XRE-family HTH domain
MMIGEALRLIRVFYDLKQTEAAAKLGVSQSYLSEVEKGIKTPSLELLGKYAEAFDLPASSILYFAENVDNPRTAPAFVAKKIVRILQFIEQKSDQRDAK